MLFIEEIKFKNKVYKFRNWVTLTILLLQVLGLTFIAFSFLWFSGLMFFLF